MVFNRFERFTYFKPPAVPEVFDFGLSGRGSEINLYPSGPSPEKQFLITITSVSPAHW
jgi:hypothetical protein